MKRFFKYLLIVIGVIFVIGLIFLFRPIASKKVNTTADEPVVDVVLVGGGIMSATLGTYLNEVEPDWTINMYERLDQVGQESSAGFNNAGTGHSGFMEMNYTPEKDGKVDIKKAIDTASQFEVSKQFWAYQVKNGVLGQPNSFINPVPHIAFASVTSAIGSVDSTVQFGLSIIPSEFVLPMLFIISAFIATAMGTSMGTIAACAPIAFGKHSLLPNA